MRGFFSIKVSESANILQMGVTTVLSGSWNGFDAFFFFSLCRLCCPERNEECCKYGIQMQAVVQPAGLRAVCAQCQRGGAHLQFSSTVHKLASLSAAKQLGQVSVCFGLLDYTYIITTVESSVVLW